MMDSLEQKLLDWEERIQKLNEERMTEDVEEAERLRQAYLRRTGREELRR